jgi:mannose-6-phosphate isomerase-like protein (cupin superfamily)
MATAIDLREEMRVAPQNRNVGTTVWFENDRTKIWEIKLAPGERVPVHCHTTDYFWVCVEPGRGRQHTLDGQTSEFDFTVGQVDFLDIAPGNNLIHDLENVGDTPLRFVTVELKDARE